MGPVNRTVAHPNLNGGRCARPVGVTTPRQQQHCETRTSSYLTATLKAKKGRGRRALTSRESKPNLPNTKQPHYTSTRLHHTTPPPPSLSPVPRLYIYCRRPRTLSPRQQTTRAKQTSSHCRSDGGDGDVRSREATLLLRSSPALLLPPPGCPRRGALLRVRCELPLILNS